MRTKAMVYPKSSDTIHVRSFAELQSSGLLWLINAAVLHPRGFALGLAFNMVDGKQTGEPIGWVLLGDGKEPWAFSEPDDEKFDAVSKTLRVAGDGT